ncbi:MAG: asparagine synthase (glutamine-hydrolyzing) [Candidatus Omnitrophota bacterium]|nr:MAG: asparagine synthase (glutamine-hydrolyzing) [Candidatus Omnitrophota bacterium]
MCGITGIFSADHSDHDLLEAMTERLKHRGPDDRGFFYDKKISLGHRRLAVIDTTSAGRQPMTNEDDSIYLVCNGEIYNYREKTSQMKARGHRFKSESDCEVLLHLYEEYGENLLDEVNGMFAFAIWDSRRNRMLIAVDRFGKKPLYYAIDNGRLIFASELKSLLFFNWINKDLDYAAIDRYLSLRYIPAPLTIFKQVKKLQQATMLIWQDGAAAIRRYWAPKAGNSANFNQLLTDAVRLRLQSDVPLGIYLSAGIDSAAIAGLMRPLIEDKKESYTVSFPYKYDEYPRAERMARYLDFGSNRISVTENDFNLMPQIMYHLDEPFGDLLCLPSFILAKRAKEKLTVVLTGDGADEIFNGYLHQRLMLIRNKYRNILEKRRVNTILSSLFKIMPLSLLNMFFEYPDRLGQRERIKLSQGLLVCADFSSFYESITSCFTEDDKKRLYLQDFTKGINHESLADEYKREIKKHSSFSFSSRLSLLDLKYWIPFSLIYRLDKMNMASAVETRSPFLDFRVVENALNLPDELKMNRRRDKEIIRRLVERLYPAAYREKGKQAFYIPMVSSYENRYRQWVSELLTCETVKRRGFFQWSYIEDLFTLSKNKSMLATRQLTSLAMLELWFKVFYD